MTNKKVLQVHEKPGTVSVLQNGKLKNEFACGDIFSIEVKPLEDELEIAIGQNCILSITTVTTKKLDSRDRSCGLYYSENKSSITDLFVPLVLHSSHNTTTAGLDLSTVGPGSFYVCSKYVTCYVFGSIKKNEGKTRETIAHIAINGASVSEKASQLQYEEKKAKKKELKLTEKTESKHQTTSEKKRQLNTAEQNTDAPLSKKQRKKLAKEKAKELEQAVAILNQHEVLSKRTTNSNASEASKNKTAVPLTKERRLKSGVLVRDFLIGTGPPVKAGRKVSITYEGRFANTDEVFDRNQSKSKPLVFRQGTGSVIKGLEEGVSGMRVGGEREITIPPELGYGKKGSGNVIPPNSTLKFTVQMVGL